ncbi:MAG: rRNA maturation RNase YbeY [Flavobacteriaceae bacterium]|nr:rRNA maturation RNase YbeY [Flavobacteriaceae bacterium]
MIKFLGLDFIKISKPKLKASLCDLVEGKGYSIDRIVYNFISIKKIIQINKEFLSHSNETDIITFDYTENKKISAEVFISIATLKKNALQNSQSAENEAIRLVFHGLLHCLGYKDKTDKQKEIMRSKEDQLIKRFHVKQTQNV